MKYPESFKTIDMVEQIQEKVKVNCGNDVWCIKCLILFCAYSYFIIAEQTMMVKCKYVLY
jgi:hypothetical protein